MTLIYGLTAAGISHANANNGVSITYARFGSSILPGVTQQSHIAAITATNIQTPVTGVGTGPVTNVSPANTLASNAVLGNDIVDPNSPATITNTAWIFSDEGIGAYSAREVGLFYHNPSDGDVFTNDVMIGYGVQTDASPTAEQVFDKVAAESRDFYLLLVLGSGASPVVRASASGSVPYATQTEADAGAATNKAINPARLKGYVDNRRATQTEAEAGTDTSKLMTPQRTAQAIGALAGGVTLLGTATGTNNNLVNVVADSGFADTDLLLGVVVISASGGTVISGVFPYSAVGTSGRNVGSDGLNVLQTRKNGGQIQLGGGTSSGTRTFYLYKLG